MNFKIYNKHGSSSNIKSVLRYKRITKKKNFLYWFSKELVEVSEKIYDYIQSNEFLLSIFELKEFSISTDNLFGEKDCIKITVKILEHDGFEQIGYCKAVWTKEILNSKHSNTYIYSIFADLFLEMCKNKELTK